MHARTWVTQQMFKLRLISLLMMVCILWPASATRSQNEDILARESDESATTKDERQRVVTILLDAARQAQDTGEALKAARYTNRVGRLQLRLNLPQEALTAYQSAQEILKQTPDPTTNIDNLNGLGAAYSHMSKCDEAQPLLQQAIALSDQSGYLAGKAQALLTLSDCQNYGDHALAVKTAQESFALWRAVGRKWGIAKAHSALGDYQLSQNNLMEATENYKEALDIWRELKISDEEAESFISLGFIEYRKGAWQDSLLLLTQAQALLDVKGEPYKMGQITGGMGEAFIESGLPETGLLKLQQSLEYFRQAQNPRALVAISWDIGRAYYFMGRYTEALAILQQALADSEAIKESVGMALCNEALGRTYVAMKQPDAALRHYQTALDLFIKAGARMEAARTNALMGQVYAQQGKVERARSYYQTALEKFRALSDHLNESATLYALGNLELQQNNLSPAEDYLRQSLDVTENIRRVSTSSDLTAAFSATVYERYESYIECLMRKDKAQPAGGFAARAFQVSEQARGRSLAELLRATQANLAPGVDPQLAAQEKSLRQLLRVKENDKIALLGREYKREELVALETEVQRLEDQYKQVTETIRARYPSFEQINRPIALDLKQIQEKIIADDNTVLLEYTLGKDRSYVWAVTRDGLKSYELPAQAQINEAAEKVYKLLSTPPTSADAPDELTPAIQKLGRMILSPVAAELNKRRIIVVADGTLNYIPFQILPAPQANDEPLVASYEVINAPSASILGELRQEAAERQPAKVLAAFGDPVFGSNSAQRKEAGGGQVAAVHTLETERMRSAMRDIELKEDSFEPTASDRLFYAKGELANLRDAASSEETFVAADYDATRERLLSTDLTQYAILHFATHGLLDTKRPENSGLVLSTVSRDGQALNGFVGLQDIYGLRAPVNLVVLSACQTALGKDVRGEGLLGLTRGFMYAGASSVVASLWKVNDKATAELMKQFYTDMLQKGMNPAAALREAQNSIRQKQQWRSPYYWAAFTLQGEYRQVIKPTHAATGATSVRRKVIVGAVVLMLLAGVGWWYFRSRLRIARARA